NLNLGTYTVTFTLTGFRTVKREGIELTAGFTATVNAELSVGAVEETITVSAESPLVDTQNARQQKALSSELLDALPAGQKNAINLIQLTPGLTTPGLADVGGSLGTYNGGGNATTFHGKGGLKREFDGMRVENMEADGNNGYILNALTVQEMTVETGGVSAESDASGFVVNMIPKEGSNSFRFTVSGLFTNDKLESDNFSQFLKDRGVTSPSKVMKIYDGSATLAGPISKDTLWFFVAERMWGNRNQRASVFWNKTLGTPFYTPDTSRPYEPYEFYRSHAARLTWQASPKNKLNFFLDVQNNCKCYSATGLQDLQDSDRYAQRFAVSYITGSHAFKTGFQLGEGVKNLHQYLDGDISYLFLRGAPTTIIEWATPYLRKERLRADLGIYGQDQWTIRRLTLSYGLRFDYYNSYVHEQHMPATRFIPARDFAPVAHLPLWKDWSPRVGAAYDPFGTGRTALKASLGRYVGKTAIGIAADNNPVTT